MAPSASIRAWAAPRSSTPNSTDRTVRRDIARLRGLGYGIESDPGPWGGYRLGGGTRVPPLILDDEEAFAVAVALREAALSGVLGSEQAALSALLKLRQVLPPRIADQLGEMDSTVVHTPRPEDRQISPGVLLELAAVCRRGERTRLSYRDHAGKDTVRDDAPYRLVHTGRRWYFVARDIARDQWRTFRDDRVVQVQPTGHTVGLVDPADPALLVSRSIAGIVAPSMSQSGWPTPWTRRYGGTRLRVLSPNTVREALLRRTRDLFEDNKDSQR